MRRWYPDDLLAVSHHLVVTTLLINKVQLFLLEGVYVSLTRTPSLVYILRLAYTSVNVDNI